MGLETATYISDLIATNPTGGDDRSTADDHMKLIKEVLKATFPNANGAINPSVAEFNKLVGLLSTTSELNQLNGSGITTAKLAVLAAVTATAIELNVLDGATLSTAELNVLNGILASTAELNYLQGASSNIQTQINALGGQTNVNAADGGPYVSATTANLSGISLAGGWESFGPTGSGATNIWTALDGVPSDINWIKARLAVTKTGSASVGSFESSAYYIRKNGSAISKTLAARSSWFGANATNDGTYSIAGEIEITIPVSSRKFDVASNDTGGTIASVLTLVGYGY